MSPNDAVQNFRAFLCAAYSHWRAAAEIALEKERGYLDEAFDDWAQANWELLVERPLCGQAEFLEIYGSGSDYEAQLYSRVFFHAAVPTHELRCQPRSDVVIDELTGDAIVLAEYSFERLVARAGTWYEDAPPFDHVVLRRRDALALVRLSELRFILCTRRSG